MAPLHPAVVAMPHTRRYAHRQMLVLRSTGAASRSSRCLAPTVAVAVSGSPGPAHRQRNHASNRISVELCNPAPTPRREGLDLRRYTCRKPRKCRPCECRQQAAEAVPSCFRRQRGTGRTASVATILGWQSDGLRHSDMRYGISYFFPPKQKLRQCKGNDNPEQHGEVKHRGLIGVSSSHAHEQLVAAA